MRISYTSVETRLPVIVILGLTMPVEFHAHLHVSCIVVPVLALRC